MCVHINGAAAVFGGMCEWGGGGQCCICPHNGTCSCICPLPSFPSKHTSLPKQRTKEIRRNAEAATRAGLYVEEVTAHSSAAVKEQVQQLAAEW